MIRHAEISVSTAANRETVWALLTDLEQSATWLPGVTLSRVLTREGDISVIEVIFAGTRRVLEVVQSPPNGARFEEVGRDGVGGVSGSWNLRDSGENGLVIEAEIRVSTPLLALGSGRKIRFALEQAAVAVVDKLRRPLTANLATYRRALALIRRGDVIEAHIGDDVIELLRIGGEE